MKLLLLSIGLALCLAWQAVARDMTELSAQLTPEQREWVRGLKDRNGVGCCDDSDGHEVQAWEIRGTGYWVKVQDQWLEVPLSALIHQANRIGYARAWLYQQNGRTIVRCFVPGSLG